MNLARVRAARETRKPSEEERNPVTLSSTSISTYLEHEWTPKSCTVKMLRAALADRDLQIEIDLGPIVELADSFGIALLALVLGVYLVVHAGGECRKTVGAVRTDDVGLHRAG